MRILSPEGEDSSKAPILGAFFVGGISGMSSWIFSYPVDYIKTVVQSDNLENKKYRSAVDCARKKYA